MVTVSRRKLQLAALAVLAIGLSGCSTFFPSRPLSDSIFVRNTTATVEVMICASAEVKPLIVGRGPQGTSSELLPLVTDALLVDDGVGFSLVSLTTLPIDSPFISPLDASERLGLTLQIQEGDRRYRMEGEFRVSEDVLAAFSRGEWLSASGGLQSDPCGP
jgi:hypothetical protein